MTTTYRAKKRLRGRAENRVTYYWLCTARSNVKGVNDEKVTKLPCSVDMNRGDGVCVERSRAAEWRGRAEKQSGVE